jgi:acyl-CoA reductase-like NAD-dependent aldehyde dehydrogenase
MADNPTMATYRWSSDRSEDRFTVENPATGDTIAVVQGGGAPEVDAAVQAAHRAFQDNWRWRSPAERAGLLLRGADVLEAHADELAELVSRENGKPVADARLHDIGFLIDIFRVLRVADRQAAQRVLRQGQRLHLDRARAAGRGRRDHPVQLAAHPRRRQDRAGGFYNKGEAGTAASRVLVHRAVHDAFVDKLAAGVNALRVRSGADPATHVGPAVTKAQQQKVLDYIRIGEAEGAKIAAQAALPAELALGHRRHPPGQLRSSAATSQARDHAPGTGRSPGRRNLHRRPSTDGEECSFASGVTSSSPGPQA